MLACDVMTRDVITVAPETSLLEIASLMTRHRISALPVLEKGKLVGIVTESDLLRRAETGTEQRRSRWAEFFSNMETLAQDYIRSHGQQAAQLMSTEMIVVQADTPLADVADVLARHHIKRVPVMFNGALVGILSRANLVQALASRAAGARPASAADDRQIRDRLIAELAGQNWVESRLLYNIVVEDGVVHLWGLIRSEAERRATIVAAETIPGVRKVDDHLTLTRYAAI